MAWSAVEDEGSLDEIGEEEEEEAWPFNMCEIARHWQTHLGRLYITDLHIISK